MSGTRELRLLRRCNLALRSVVEFFKTVSVQPHLMFVLLVISQMLTITLAYQEILSVCNTRDPKSYLSADAGTRLSQMSSQLVVPTGFLRAQ